LNAGSTGAKPPSGLAEFFPQLNGFFALAQLTVPQFTGLTLAREASIDRAYLGCGKRLSNPYASGMM